MSKKAAIRTLDQLKDEHFGKKGTPRRDKLEKGYKEFNFGIMRHKHRPVKELAQESLSENQR